ncbi:MAG: hypothetical protein ACOH19_15615 [Rhodoglobus sp.]
MPAHAATSDLEPTPPASSEEVAEQLLIDDGIPAEALPAETVGWLAAKIDSGSLIGSTSSSTYSNQDPNTPPGTITPLAYETAPCYLTVITEYNFASPEWVDNDSYTGCTAGFATTTRHDMELIKQDAVFGTTSVVASGASTGTAGGFSSYARYGCPTSAGSGFMGDTAGEILYGGSYYYAEATSGGWDSYNCG